MDKDKIADAPEEQEGVTGKGADPEASDNADQQELFSGMAEEAVEEESSEDPAEAVPDKGEPVEEPSAPPVPPTPETPPQVQQPQGIELKDVAQFMIMMAGETVPNISPELSDEQKEEMGETAIQAYETQRKIELLEAKAFVREQASRATMGVREIQQIANKYSTEDVPLSPTEVWNHMRARRILLPEDAARSLSYEKGMRAAEQRGEQNALRRVSKPVNPARSFRSTGQPVKPVKFYKDDAEAHAGGVAILRKMEDEKEGRQGR